MVTLADCVKLLKLLPESAGNVRINYEVWGWLSSRMEDSECVPLQPSLTISWGCTVRAPGNRIECATIEIAHKVMLSLAAGIDPSSLESIQNTPDELGLAGKEVPA